MRSVSGTTNWIPASFQESAVQIARNAVKEFVNKNQVIGLGSGPMAAAIVRELANLNEKESLQCIPSSYQIKLEAECGVLRIADEMIIPLIDVVFDGADEIDSEFNMIKGGGGALLREKVLHSCARKVVIAAETHKFVNSFTWPVPIEVHPFAIHAARKRLQEIGNPSMRMLDEGYPYVTENGNMILDTSFSFTKETDIGSMERELKNIPGIMEVGLFSRKAEIYYQAKEDGSFDIRRR